MQNYSNKYKSKQIMKHKEKCNKLKLTNISAEIIGEKLRGMMPWIGANRLVDKAKN